MMEHKRICADIIATEDALSPFVGYGSFFELLSPPSNIVLVFTAVTAKSTLSP
jgi:hypothetical protein